MNIFSICNEPGTLNIIRIVVLLINIIKIVIPVVLIIFLMIKIMGAVTKQNQEEIAKTIRSSIPNIVAAVLIFLVPTFVDIVARLSFPNSDYAKCISGISKEKIEIAYDEKMSNLLSKAIESEKYSDYAAAYSYLQNITDKTKRSHYESRLAELKEIIDKKDEEKNNIDNPDININFDNFKWTYYERYSEPLASYYKETMPYAIWGPSDLNELNSTKLPLIIWLHGAVGINKYCPAGSIKKHRIIKTIENWKSTGLKPLTAIIMAPQHCSQNDGSWRDEKGIETIKAMIKYATDKYNIDQSKIVLMGHSDGGSGVVYVSRFNQDLFSALVVMSGFQDFNAYADYYKRIPLRGYMTKNPARAADPNGGGDGNTGMERIFSQIGRSQDLIMFPKEVTHDEVQEKAFTTDQNNNGVSDLMEWITSGFK